jgi:hypothetical protein
MPSHVHGLVLALLVAAIPAVGAADSTPLRFSGQVSAVDPGGGTILVEELGAGVKGRPTVIQHSVTIGPATRIEVVERITGDGGLPGTFKESPASQADLRAGDFVTVIGERRGRDLHAGTVSIIRPDPAR